MRTNSCRRWTIAALAALAFAACQSPDVGQPCALDVTVDPNSSADYLETGLVGQGNQVCDNLVCIWSPNSRYQSEKLGYCSKTCVSNNDCFQSDTGLVCRQVVLDPAFLSYIQSLASTDPEKYQQYQQYLGTIQHSSYCATPK